LALTWYTFYMDTTNIGYWEQVLQNPTLAFQELFNAEKKYLLEHITNNAKVLDVGSGSGRNIETVLLKTKDVFGIDNDPKAIKDSLAKFSNTLNVKIIQSDATELPFEDNTFDIAILMIVIGSLDNKKIPVLKEIQRVLKQDGKLILSSYSEDAFEERMKIYKQVNAPIEKIEGTKVVFNKSLGANVSEQFSKEELEKFGKEANLKMIDCEKVETIAYICTFNKEGI